MPFPRKELPSNPPPANSLASQSTQQQPPRQQPYPAKSQSHQQNYKPQLVCTWSAHTTQSGPSPSLFPRNRHTLTATATAAYKLFLFGGYESGPSSSDIYVFSTQDFSTTILKTSGKVPTPRTAHSATLIGTTLLICGGKVGASDQNVLDNDSLYLLNLVSREWTRVVVNGSGPAGSHRYHTTTVVGSKLFVFGGETDKKRIINDMWTLDLNCLKSQPLWQSYESTPGNKKPLPRSRHVSVATEDRIIIFGGFGNQQYYNDTWSFDISTRKWTELQCTGSIPSPRGGHAAVLVNDVMCVFGGYSGKIYLDDLIGLQLSTQRWFKFHNVGPSPHGRAYHTMTSDGTRVFVLGGLSKDARADEIPLIHVFDTKDIKCPEPEGNAVNPNEKTTQLAQKSSTSPPTKEQPQHLKSSSSETHGASHLQNATPTGSGRPASSQITHERNPDLNVQPLELNGVNIKPRCVPEREASESSTEYHAKSAAPDSSSKGEVTRLDLERQLSALLAAQTERDQRIAQQTEELAKKSALLEQAEANAVEAARRAGSELREYVDDQRLMWTSLVKQRDVELVEMQARLRDMQVKLDELVLSRDQELSNVRAKLEAKESELEAVCLRLADAEKGRTSLDELVVSRDQQVGQYEKELANVRAKLEAKESELEAVCLRLTDPEEGSTKSKAKSDTLRVQNATGSVNKDEDQLTRRLMERVRAMMEAEMSSKRNEKSIEEEKCTNE